MSNDQTRISQLILEFGTISISIELMSRQDKGKKFTQNVRSIQFYISLPTLNVTSARSFWNDQDLKIPIATCTHFGHSFPCRPVRVLPNSSVEFIMCLVPASSYGNMTSNLCKVRGWKTKEKRCLNLLDKKMLGEGKQLP